MVLILILKGYEIKYQTMGYSVMVARLILVQSVRVRILVPQYCKPYTSLQKEMNRLLDDFLGREDLFRPGNYPFLDISETNDSIIVKAELPGVDPKGVSISYDLRHFLFLDL